MASRKLENFTIKQKIVRKFAYTAYDAVDKKTDTAIRLKLLNPEWQKKREVVDDFLLNAREAKKLKHPGIYRILTAASDNSFHYITCESSGFKPLTNLISDKYELAFEDLLKILKNLTEALNYAHSKGQVHGILSPESIHVNPNAEVKIDDFGFHWSLPHIFESDDEEAHYLLRYIAPEYYKNPELREERADIYSVGMVLFHLLNGAPAYHADSASDIQLLHLKGRLPELSYSELDLPDAFESFMTKTTSRFKERRFQSVAEMASAVDALCDEHGITVTSDTYIEQIDWQPEPEKTSTPEMSKTKPGKIVAIIAILLMLATAGYWGITTFLLPGQNREQGELSELLLETNGYEDMEFETVLGESSETEEGESDAFDDAQETAKDNTAKETPPEPSSESTQTSILVESGNRPLRANVFLNNRFAGKTDENGRLQLTGLAEDNTYTVRVVKEGYVTATRKFNPALDARLAVELKAEERSPNSGKVILDAVPAADEIYVNGKQYDRPTPLELELPWGQHHIRFVNKRMGKEWETNIDLKAGQVLRVKHDFNRLKFGRVAVSLSNAFEFGFGYVYVDGELWQGENQTTPQELKLPVGTYRIALKREGFQATPEEVTVKVEENTTKYVSFTFKKTKEE